MFIDEVEIYTKAGNGGNGAVSFRREKYIPYGGPDGGDGGRGGDVIIEVDNHTHGLSFFTRQQKYLAEDGQNGTGKKRSGKNGEDLVLKVPTGTAIYEKDELLADLTEAGEKINLLKGGNGGWGNQHFASSIKQAPEWAKDGMKGESKKIRLVWKTIADVGLVGMPNAGKSTLLSVLTSARPKIADYPFTTLEPNLGTYIDNETRIIFADIPGLIEGASKGKGLGDKFLKHIERTTLLVLLVEATSADPIDDYKIVRAELSDFSKKLLAKIEIVVITKSELVDDERIKAITAGFKKIKIKPLVISAVSHNGIPELINAIKKEIR